MEDRKPAAADSGPIKRGMGIASRLVRLSHDSSCEVRVSRTVGGTECRADLALAPRRCCHVVAEEFVIRRSRL